MTERGELPVPIDCELIIGLVGAVGTRFSEVTQKLESQLGLAGYTVDKIKVSRDVIAQIVAVDNHTNDYERYSAYMKAGNEARRRSKESTSNGPVNGNPGILALGVAARIFEKSIEEHDEREPRFKRAYIVESLKRKEEVEVLRTIYGEGFILLGIHESETLRIQNLSSQDRMTEAQAKELIKRDHAEVTDPFGQRVSETFHLADFFVELCDTPRDLDCNIRRLVEIWFGHPFRTPTFDEYAMFMAHSAALRSADLSRQVGAVLTKDKMILSTGANECPRPLGGLYWPESTFVRDCENDSPNGRDYRRGVDSNRAAQVEIIDKIVALFHTDQTTSEAIEMRRKLDASPIKDITEYGRVVHAEMETLLACARLGISTQHTTLYSTTFPCHNCAKHIIAAGVEKVIYIEPYPKSKALSHHSDAISETSDSQKVQFIPFTGVGPRRFFDLFSIDGSTSYKIQRKDRETGNTVKWQLQQSRLRIQMRAFTYLEAETQAARIFNQLIPNGTPAHD